MTLRDQLGQAKADLQAVMSNFLRWVSLTHTMRYHAHYHTASEGHIYQGRFKSFPVQDDDHFLVVCRYVERNAWRAGLVEKAQDWKWGSLSRWLAKPERDPKLLFYMADSPVPELEGTRQCRALGKRTRNGSV